MTRRALREHCFKILFCTDFYPASEAEEQITRYFEQDEEDETDEEGHTEIIHLVNLSEKAAVEIKTRVEDIIPKIPEIDETIAGVTEGWSLKRIGKAELSILRLAVYEMKFDEAIPEKVAINEAVELAKKYCGEESPAFINGILAKLAEA